MINFIKIKLKEFVKEELRKNDKFEFLEKNVIELNNYNELKKALFWKEDPILERPDIYDYEYIEDANERRIRDAESLATVTKNAKPLTVLEIGTSDGMGTVLLAANAPGAKIYTVNISPEEILAGKGGNFTTIALEKEKIGKTFRDRNIESIIQIYANTATWNPDLDSIDVAFIDGCHDTEFVYNDTKKVLPLMKKGGFILWHDFDIGLAKKYSWINDVCLGVEKLYEDGLIDGRMYHIKDSWVGIYQVK